MDPEPMLPASMQGNTKVFAWPATLLPLHLVCALSLIHILATCWSGFSAAMTLLDAIIVIPMKPDENGNIFNPDPMRERRLLAHKSEIRRLHQQCKLQGLSLIHI